MPLIFKKSTNTSTSKFAGQHGVAAGTKQQKWTDTRQILSPGLMISYHAAPAYPTEGQKDLLLAAASSARTIMRKALREMDRVVFFRQKEGQAFTNIMNYHFGLAAGRPGGLPASNVVDKSFSMRDVGQTDRRWALNKIRQGMLSLSFHLNTGMYLIDVDNANRDIKSGAFPGVAGTVAPLTEEGYCTWASWAGLHKGMLSAWKNGEIHVAFKTMHDDGYLPMHYARVIIHEAAHKYLGVTDKKYAHELPFYAQLSFSDCLDNADSFAWAALSLNAGHLIKGKHSKDSKPRLTAIA